MIPLIPFHVPIANLESNAEVNDFDMPKDMENSAPIEAKSPRGILSLAAAADFLFSAMQRGHRRH